MSIVLKSAFNIKCDENSDINKENIKNKLKNLISAKILDKK